MIDNNFHNESLLTPKEVAEILMVSPITVRQWAQKGMIRAYTTAGGHRRFKLSDVENFITESKKRKQKQNGLRILVIDDDESFLKLVTNMFSELDSGNIQIETSNNGFDGGLKVHTFKPDILLLDLKMDGIDGFEVCKEVKNNPQTSHIRVIILSGVISVETEKKVLELGAEAYLSKPLDISRLFEIVGVK